MAESKHCVFLRDFLFSEGCSALDAAQPNIMYFCIFRVAQDQTFSCSRCVFYPQHGIGPGCPSPMDFEAKLTHGLKHVNGGLEMLWQLANFSFDKWLDGCVSKAFAHYARVCLLHFIPICAYRRYG
eukprot:4652889-Pleurochrysis_carterae.AAC.5